MRIAPRGWPLTATVTLDPAGSRSELCAKKMRTKFPLAAGGAAGAGISTATDPELPSTVWALNPREPSVISWAASCTLAGGGGAPGVGVGRCGEETAARAALALAAGIRTAARAIADAMHARDRTTRSPLIAMPPPARKKARNPAPKRGRSHRPPGDI